MTDHHFSPAVTAQRAPGSAADRDFFPTPPWATRALLPILCDPHLSRRTIWEPACGEGHMALPLLESSGARVVASDIEDRPWADKARRQFIGGGGARIPQSLDFLTCRNVAVQADWVITNPPFNLAEAFVDRALKVASVGVAMLVRTSWVEGTGRFDRLFDARPPYLIAQFSERVPMVKGRWDPDASTATAYAWFVWSQDDRIGGTRFTWIPPGQKALHHRQIDLALFDAGQASPLFPAQV